MDENQVLNEMLLILDQDGAESAYGYLCDWEPEVEAENKSQIYNFLACLAAACGRSEDALEWLEEALVIQGLWYRPESFDDPDLESLFGLERFENFRRLSTARFQEAERSARPLLLPPESPAPEGKLAAVLHGDFQDGKAARKAWAFLERKGWALAALQSRELAACGLYRWTPEGDGPEQAEALLRSAGWENARPRLLAGFGSGCDVILRGLDQGHFFAERLILVAPISPYGERNARGIQQNLASQGCRVLLICGQEDEDCSDLAEALCSGADPAHWQIHWAPETAHALPADLSRIATEWLTAAGQA
ncbi:MAG: hypothetical protein IJP07_02955 [Firmicutes bacterium]|nr:hypothetical protein [Bacillota bacterium]